jgi:D-alanyl-D-alanine carboxypeptidase
LSGLATIIALTAVSSDPADARTRRKRVHTHAYSPAYAAIVVDANSGAVLHAASPDATRHPASLTKIMTLYMLFERLESGRLTLDSPLHVSDHAAGQSPTKLGLREGQTISVEDAIKGMVTRSANDAAVVVAENLAGSESEFARQMTRKARAIGMSNTVYRNASGLPDSAQVTTARDQATLGRAIQERFPRYYRYFSIRSFTFRGQRIGNHNRLLGKVEGVDGIKTGYIRASGFNLVTSVKRDNRHVVAVVLGGTSGGARDARMRQLLAQYVDKASTRRTAPLIAEAREAPSVREAPAPRAAHARAETKAPDRFEMASASSVPVRLAPSTTGQRPAPAAGSSDPIRPVAVRTVSVRPAARAASAAPAPVPPEPVAEPTVQTGIPMPARAGILGYLPSRIATASVPEPEFAQPAQAPAQTANLFREAAPPPEAAPAPTRAQSRPQSRSGWVIQVGAYPAESEAQQQLASVKTKASRLLAAANPFTEPVQRGKSTLYRARFAGLDREQAEAACRFLKRNDVDCLAMRN